MRGRGELGNLRVEGSDGKSKEGGEMKWKKGGKGNEWSEG